MAGKRKRGGGSFGKGLERSAKAGGQDGANKAVYVLAFGAVFAGIMWAANWVKNSGRMM